MLLYKWFRGCSPHDLLTINSKPVAGTKKSRGAPVFLFSMGEGKKPERCSYLHQRQTQCQSQGKADFKATPHKEFTHEMRSHGKTAQTDSNELNSERSKSSALGWFRMRKNKGCNYQLTTFTSTLCSCLKPLLL